MATHIIELNDRGIQISDTNDLLGISPGVANISAKQQLFGEEARQVSYLHPHQNFSHYWSQLSLDPLTTNNKHFRHNADIAFAQLNSLSSAHSINGDVIFAVPAHYNHSQLAILLGLAKQCSFNTVGLVDLSLLHCAALSPHSKAVFVDLQLHQAVLSLVNHDGQSLYRDEILQVPGAGLLNLHNAWVNMISDEFIRQCRFDPQHNAETEQYLHDQLALWLAEAQLNNEILLEVNNKGSVHQARLTLTNFNQTAINIAQRIQQEALSIASADTAFYIPMNISKMPGFAATFENIITVPESESAHNGFATLDHIVGNADSLSLVTHFPALKQKEQSSTSQDVKPTQAQATHLLIDHHAYALPQSALYINFDDPKEPDNESFNLDLKHLGIKEVFSINNDAQGYILHSKSSSHLLLNGQPVDTSAQLTLGDSISFANSDAILQFIRVK